MRSISELRQAEEKAEKNSQIDLEKTKWSQQKQEGDNDEEERRMRSEMLRRQRTNEAQALIKQRSIDAKAVFEQHTSAGQLSISRRSSSSNLSSPSPTPNSATKVSPKWPPSPNPASPAPTSPTPMPTSPVVQSNSIPTNFYPSNRTPEPTRSPVPLNDRHESPVPANIVPPAPDFADIAPTNHRTSPVEEPKAPLSPAIALLQETNGFHDNHVDETDDKEWDAEPDQIVIPASDTPAENVIEADSNDSGIRARALYDYQAGKDIFIDHQF